MARILPTPSQKIQYLLCIFIGVGILYIDYKTDYFKKIKHNYKSFVISTSYILKNYTIEPIKKNINQFKTRKTLIKENENLKKMQCHIPEHRKLIIFSDEHFEPLITLV